MVRPAAADLDEVDQRILRRLAADARTPNNLLAAEAGVAPSTCLMRVRRLQQLGVIEGYHARVSPAAVGRPLQALVSVRLASHARARIAEFGAWLATLPGVQHVYFLAGAQDFQIHVAARTPDDLRDFVVENLSASRDVAMTETHLIFSHVDTGGAVLD